MDTDPVHYAHKICFTCGKITEFLRFRCPGCNSEMFDVASVEDPAMVDRMWALQKRSMQHTDQGAKLFQQGLADEALQEFHKAIETNRWNATAHGNIGIVYLRRGDPREALRWFEMALEIDPEVAGAKKMAETVRRQIR